MINTNALVNYYPEDAAGPILAQVVEYNSDERTVRVVDRHGNVHSALESEVDVLEAKAPPTFKPGVKWTG